MVQVLYSAKAADGSATQGYVEASSSQQARATLEARGLRDIVLHQEMISAGAPQSIEGLSEAEIAALAAFSIRTMRSPSLLGAWAEIVRRSWKWLLVDLAILYWGIYSRQTWLMALGLVLLALPFLLSAWAWRHAGRYDRLLKAYAVGQWDTVRTLAKQLRAASSQTQLLDFDLDVRLATIEARDGRLDAGLQSVAHWKAKLATQPGLYEGRVSSVYLAAGDTAAYLQMAGESLAALPKDPSRTVDHALAHARFGSAERAESLMAECDPSLLPPHAEGFVLWIQGLLLMRRGQPEALERLGEATSAFISRAEQPAIWTALAASTADHAMALSAAGRAEEARRQLAYVWPVLQAHAQKPLLRMLEAEGLVPSAVRKS